MGKRYTFNESELNQMVKYYNEDLLSTKAIAKIYNVDESVITSRLKKMGVKIAKGSAYSKNYWLQRGLTEDEAENKLKSFKPIYIEYWLQRGLTEDEAKFKIECHLMNTERAFIYKYGKERGLKLFKNQKNKQGKLNSKRSVEYWLSRGYSESDAKKMVSDNQSTFSLEKCIERYGEEKGLKVFTERQNKWQKSLTENGNMKLGYSKISQELFWVLIEQYSLDERCNLKFATHNGEYRINNPDGGVFLYDFTDLNNMKIIEYNGDSYHANPKKYLAEDYPHPFRKTQTAKEIWEKDKLKVDLVNKEGFDVLTIWDSEYRKNKKEVIKKCIKFLLYE